MAMVAYGGLEPQLPAYETGQEPSPVASAIGRSRGSRTPKGFPAALQAVTLTYGLYYDGSNGGIRTPDTAGFNRLFYRTELRQNVGSISRIRTCVSSVNSRV